MSERESLLQTCATGECSLLQQRIDALDADVNSLWNQDKHSLLYLACKHGHLDCVRVLLKNGAKLVYKFDKSTKLNCLNAAIDAEQGNVVIFILSQENWMDAFRFYDGTLNAEECTPFRKLIKKMPEAAKLVLDKLCKWRVVSAEYFYREVTYSFELLEDYQDIHNNSTSGQETSRDTECLQLQSRRASQDEETPEPYQWGPKDYKYSTHPLYLMVRYKRMELLTHELVTSFLCMRWNTFLKYIYYSNLITYILLMILLTMYMHIYLHSAEEYADSTNQTLTNCTVIDDDESITTDFFARHAIHSILIIAAVVIVLICLFRLFTEMLQMVANMREYLSGFLNYVEVFIYFSTIVFVCNGDFLCLSSWRWQLGAICIFLSWLNFVFFLRLQPNYGIYVIMFEETIGTFLKVLPLALLLIFAFGQPFLILLGPIITESDPFTRPFSNLGYSFMKTLTMMVGEFETDPLLYSVPSILLFPVTTYGLWIIFVLVMPILMQNLLVGLAVDNIKGIRKNAKFKREVAQVKVLLTLMSSKVFFRLLAFCMRKNPAECSGQRFVKNKGKVYTTLGDKMKHRVSNLINYAWKPEDVPATEFLTKNKKNTKVLERLDMNSKQLAQISEQIQALSVAMSTHTHNQATLSNIV